VALLGTLEEEGPGVSELKGMTDYKFQKKTDQSERCSYIYRMRGDLTEGVIDSEGPVRERDGMDTAGVDSGCELDREGDCERATKGVKSSAVAVRIEGNSPR
jgi:hypothetical protein